MEANEIIEDLLRREGSTVVNHPADRGGWTKFGITQITLGRYLGRDATPEDVQELTEETARDVYRTMYIEPYSFMHVIDQDLLLALVVDCAVQHGGMEEPNPDDRQAVLWLQLAAGVKADGWIGQKTREAVKGGDTGEIFRRVLDLRIEYYGELIAHDDALQRAAKDGYHLQAQFALGWMRRCGEFVLETP